MTPIFLFDLDGTLANCTHRLPLLPDWDAFFAACSDDVPIANTLFLFRTLTMHPSDSTRVLTGRSNAMRTSTLSWLHTHAQIGLGTLDDILHMRPENDHRPDVLFKRDWMRSQPVEFRAAIAGIFEDRSRVCQMWRDEGYTCYQVAQGDY